MNFRYRWIYNDIQHNFWIFPFSFLHLCVCFFFLLAARNQRREIIQSTLFRHDIFVGLVQHFDTLPLLIHWFRLQKSAYNIRVCIGIIKYIMHNLCVVYVYRFFQAHWKTKIEKNKIKQNVQNKEKHTKQEFFFFCQHIFRDFSSSFFFVFIFLFNVEHVHDEYYYYYYYVCYP